MKYDNKNFILAIVLSMLIILGWQYFYAKPLQDKLAQQTAQTTAREDRIRLRAWLDQSPGCAAG
jgi:predicted negative regulator of RcsB-dependent stress response